MLQDLGDSHLNEKRVFHGTNPQNLDAICAEGFDNRVANMGGSIGAGRFLFHLSVSKLPRQNKALHQYIQLYQFRPSSNSVVFVCN